MTSQGTVREWDDNEGVGVIESPDTPGGCWAHFSCVVMEGFRGLVPGDPVSFSFEPGRQDGYSFRAVQVWPPGVPVGTTVPSNETETDAVYITLTVESPDGTVTTYGPDDPEPWS